MIISIDDSGDPGLKLEKGSSNYFVIAAVCFADDLDAEEAALKIKRLRRDLGWKPSHEFKFRKTSPAIRKQFLNTVKNCNFDISLVIQDKKSLVGNKDFEKHADQLYNTVVLKSIKALGDNISAAHIYIDGEKGKNYRRNVKTFFRKHTKKQLVKELTYRDSRDDNLIQLADMIVGSARRSVEKDKDTAYLRIIKKRIKAINYSI